MKKEVVMSFYSSRIGPHNGDLYSTRERVALGWRSTSDAVHRVVRSCTPGMAYYLVCSSYRSCSESVVTTRKRQHKNKI